MRTEERLAKEISEKAGGASNISQVAHCMTKLRIAVPKETSRANIAEIKDDTTGY